MLLPRPIQDIDPLGMFDWLPSLGEVVVDSETTPGDTADVPFEHEIIIDLAGTAQVHRRMLNLSTRARLFGRMPPATWPAAKQEHEPVRPTPPRFLEQPPPESDECWEPEVLVSSLGVRSAGRIETNTTRAPTTRALEQSATSAPLLAATLLPAPPLTAAMPPAPPGPVMLIRSATQPVQGLLHVSGRTFSGAYTIDVECANAAADHLLHSEPIAEAKLPVAYRPKPFVLDRIDVAAGRTQADLDQEKYYSPTNSVVHTDSVALMCDDSSGSASETSSSDSDDDDKNLPETLEGWRHILCEGDWSVIQKAFNSESTLYYRDSRALLRELDHPVPIPNGIWSAIYDHHNGFFWQLAIELELETKAKGGFIFQHSIRMPEGTPMLAGSWTFSTSMEESSGDTIFQAKWENENPKVRETAEMTVEMSSFVRSHISTPQAIANAEACKANTIAEKGWNENYRKVRKLFTLKTAEVLSEERSRAADESKSFDKVCCPQCNKLHPRPK